MMPGEIEGDHEHRQKETITNHTSYNAPPPFIHSRLLPLRQEALAFHYWLVNLTGLMGQCNTWRLRWQAL
jgi:hypothetical protein